MGKQDPYRFNLRFDETDEDRRVRNRTHGGVRGRGFNQNPLLLDLGR